MPASTIGQASSRPGPSGMNASGEDRGAVLGVLDLAQAISSRALQRWASRPDVGARRASGSPTASLAIAATKPASNSS